MCIFKVNDNLESVLFQQNKPPPTRHRFIPLKVESLRHVCLSFLIFTQEDCSIFGNQVKQEAEHRQKHEESAQFGRKKTYSED